MINFKVRLQSKPFLVAIISALIIVIQSFLNLFGISYDFGPIQSVIDAVLYLLVIMGIVNDPTTKGFNDSEVAMSKTSINETAEEVLSMINF